MNRSLFLAFACIVTTVCYAQSQIKDETIEKHKANFAKTCEEILMEADSEFDSCRMTVTIHRRYFCYTMQVDAWLTGTAYNEKNINHNMTVHSTLSCGTKGKDNSCYIILHMANGIVLNIKEPHHSQDNTPSADHEELSSDGTRLKRRFLLSDFELEQLKKLAVTSVTFIAPDGHRYKQILSPDRQTLFIRLLQQLD